MENVKKAIVFAGGGSVLNPDNVTTLKSTGKIFFLDVTPETVLKRLDGNTTRPLLQRPDKEKAVRKLLNARRDKYIFAADYVVKSANESPMIATKEIISNL